MPVDPRFTVALATADDRRRHGLHRILTPHVAVRALRSDPRAAFGVVHARRPDVLVCDEHCGTDVLQLIGAGDRPPATWVVLLRELHQRSLPYGVSALPIHASDRRILAAVTAAGRFARIGLRTAPRPTLAPVALAYDDEAVAQSA